MFRNRRLAERRCLNQFADGPLSLEQQVEDLPSVRLAEDDERWRHRPLIYTSEYITDRACTVFRRRNRRRSLVPTTGRGSAPSRRHLSICLTIARQSHTLKDVVNRLEELDHIFHALADPSRRAMVERLVVGPASVSHLAEPLAMSLPAVVQHLGVLEEAGVVSSAKIGRVRTCRLEPGGLRVAEAWLKGRRTIWENRLDRLATELGQPAEPPQPGEQPQN